MSAPASSRTGSSRGWPAWLQIGAAAASGLLYPPRCTFCDADCIARLDEPLWCDECDRHLAGSAQPACPRCALPCPEADAGEGPCPNCRGTKLLYDEARAVGLYDGRLREAVLKTKHAYYEPLAQGLGERLARSIALRPFAEQPTLVAPVPMFWPQRIWRGTNGAETIARALAGKLRVPIAAGLLVCRRWLQRQHTLKSDERRRNVRGAFRASWRFNIRQARILVVDDVLTTGATAHEAARALRQSGAEKVYVAAVARSTYEP